MRNRVAGIVVCLFLIAIASVSVSAQEFQKSYSVGAGSRISVRNVSGDVIVTGYDGGTVQVKGFKEGEDRDLVQVEDLSGPNSVDVRVKYPENCNRCNASVRFEVQVPRSVSYEFEQLSSASGDITVKSVTGNVRVKTASGDTDIDGVDGSTNVSVASGDITIKNAAGPVTAKSASGDVDVEIVRLEGNDAMEFSSASGDVKVVMPANLDADVDMSTLSGELKTDFGLQVEERERGPGKRAMGKLGAGSRRLRIRSVSGAVSLTRN
jgi:hypothetical protein